MTIIITLSFAGNETGPFDLYSDATGFAIPFAQNVSKAALLAGYQVDAPDGTTTVRLDNLNSFCGSTDIYSCATPNCDFAGSIICDVTTTTTTTPPPTTTTTTSLPPVTLCTWTSFGGNPGEIGVYNMINNTVSAVLVPNDFQGTQGVTRPICATQTKLWLSGETDDNSFNFIIKEYNISNISSPPTLSFVREITVSLENVPPIGLTYTGIQCTTITAINDTTLVVGFGGPTATNIVPSVAGYNIDISATGNIALILPSSYSDRIDLGASVNTYGGTISNPGVLHLNNGQVISSFRLDFDNSSDGRIGNWIQQKTLSAGANGENLTAPIKLQDLGIPEFTSSYTGEKYMDMFSREGVLYVLHPETLVLYTVQQQPPYTASTNFTVTSDAPSVFSTTGCSNVDLYFEDPCDSSVVLPWLNVREENGQSGAYIGPVSFDYQGMTVQGSSVSATSSPTGFGFYGPSEPDYIGAYTGLVIPQAGGVILKGVSFDYTITFPQPVNNVAVRVGVLNTNFSDGVFTDGDIYQADTNTETPTITISRGYGVNVVGNQFGGGVYSDNDSNGEFIISCETNYTVLTISGSAPTGGPIALGCNVPPLNCRLVYSTDSASNSCLANPGRCLPGQNSFKKYFAWNVNTNTQQEILLPSNTATNSPNFALSENYIIVDVPSFVTGFKKLARYGYTDINGIPSDTTFDGQFIDYPVGEVRSFGNIMEAVTDTKFLGLWLQKINQPFPTAVSQIIEWELSGTTLSYSVKIDVGVHGYMLQGDLVLTFKTDGTPNKIIAVGYTDPPLQPDNSNPAYLLQFDYTTNALDGVVNLPAGVRGTASLGIYDEGIYIASSNGSTAFPELRGVWRFDLETLQWTQLDPADVPVEMGLPSSSPDDFASTPICRISNGITSFDPPPTTTTTTTKVIPGVNTIWTWFEAVTPTTTTTTVAPTTTTTTTLAPLVGCLEFDYLTLVTYSSWVTDPPDPVGVDTPSLLAQVAFNTGPTTNTTGYTFWHQVPNTNYDVVFNIGGVDYTAVYQLLNVGIGGVTVSHGKFSTNNSNLAAMSAFQFSKIDANGNDLSSILSTFDYTNGDGVKVTAYGDCTTPTTTTTTTTATPEDIPCTDGLDVAFIVDYTQSMGDIVENVKAGIADIVNAISTESGAGGYRLSLISADENSNAFPNYLNCSDYINLPNVQKIINGPNPSMDPANTGDLDVYQFITAWELFGDNNEATFNQQLQKLNGGVDGTCIQLGAGLYASEPTDYAAKLVTESNFAGAFRANVAKHIVILTDQFPGSTRDYFDEVTWQGIQDMITYANANGIKYFVLGEGVDKVGGDQGSSPAVDGIYPWRELAEQTGGSWSNDASSQEIQQKIIAGCNPTTTTTTTVTPG